MKLEKEELHALIKSVIASFIEKDSHLLTVNSSERSMTHALAVQMAGQKEFEGWNIDCEYSRNGEEIKKVNLQSYTNLSDSLTSKIVYPDVVIHRRGENDNLLVIEVKKAGTNSDYDRTKLKAYIEQLGYQHGLLLTLPSNSTGKPEYEWWHKSGSSGAVQTT